MKSLLAVEKVTLLYNAFTILLILILWGQLASPTGLLMPRIAIAMMTIVVGFLFASVEVLNRQWLIYVRVLLQLALLSFWYPDTFEFNRILPNLDHVFASAEQWLFASQPAILFSQNFPSKWVSEALNLGYFAYFPMMIGIGTYVCWRHYDKFLRWAFLLAASFYIYYVLYIFIPVAGPQFYFPAIGWDNAVNGNFANVGNYFNLHPTLQAGTSDQPGFFHTLVELSQAAGERPTAAFPSSHVGISTILMIMAMGISRRLFWFMFPFYILLCLATVYIQAHYAVDSIAGFLLAFPIYMVVRFIYAYPHSQTP